MTKPTTLSKFWPDYLKYIRANLKPRTVSEYERLYNRLIEPKFGRRRMNTLTTGEIEKWHLSLRDAGPAQANRATAVLSAILKLAARWGYIPVNPAAGVQYAKEQERRAYLSPDDRRKFLLAAVEEAPRDCAFLVTLYYTGARPGELLAARREEWTGDAIDLSDSKTGPRVIYLPPPAQRAIGGLSETPDGLLFSGVNPTTLWRRVRRQAGLQGLRLYDLRHTFASAGLEAGMSLEEISQLLGHKNPKTTRRYTHLTREAGTAGAAKAASVLESSRG